MNKVLMEQITRHILASLGVIPSSFIDYNKSRALVTKEFLLDQKLVFKNEGGDLVKNPIYGCQVAIEKKDFKILLGDCSQDKNTPEYCLVTKLTDNPAYGLYLVNEESMDSEALIAVTINDKDWMPCTTFLQATFLAAMEQLKDIGMGWNKCTNYQSHYNMLLSMINFHTAYSGDGNEG